MASVLAAVAVVVIVVVAVVILVALLVSRLFKKVPQGQALVVSKWRSVVVTFTGQIVIPVIHKAEIMDISVKNIQIERRGKGNGLICKDNIRADISIEFFVKVDPTEQAVKKVAQAIGCERASDIATLNTLFAAKFSEALKTVGKKFDFESLYTDRDSFRDEIVEIIGKDLNGYVLEDVAIDYLEQTPLADFDPDNILDADGIRKITERTAVQHIETNKAEQLEREETTRRTVDADKAVFEMERDRAEAEARQQQEIRTVQAQSDAEAKLIEEAERKRSEEGRLSAEQGIGVANENKDREIAIAGLNRERVVKVEAENIERDRLLAVTGRETAVAEAGKEKEERARELADVARGRVEADLGVAEKEEAIATLRVVEDAQRQADAEIRSAEGTAQALFVGTVKEAEASRQAATSEAERATILARANADAAQQDSLASQRRAEGAQAEAAADGLATVQVERERAEAIKATGLAEVDVKRADAEAVQALGTAEGEATKARLAGEGAGLQAKAEGVGAMTAAGQDHEEFRLRLETDKEVALAGVNARADVAKSAASALGEAMSNADMKIVSDESIVERILSAAGHGQAIDGFIGNSDSAKRLLSPYLDGEENLVQDVAEGIGGVGASGIRDLTVAEFVARLGGRLGDGQGGSALIDQLRDAVESSGIAGDSVADVIDVD
ncbi:SPFH domain-containing protein [Ilumatobacter nonamiensis]|uniref:SPFH domain-containing protein n=1 Tax=Ilumatobacter nonamiensis TaxID=467093 RepID=UPI00058E60EA|nr:SPFH domain-containing protein [Ilumatobacter nonamiensis]